jgi:hypothetical protein
VRLHPHNALPSWRLIAGTAAVATLASVSLAFSRPAVMEIDGQQITSDVAPVTAGGVAYLPVRVLDDAAGAITSFDPDRREIVVRRGTATLAMRIGERRATLNGRTVELTHAPFTVHGHAMVRGIDVAAVLASAVQYDPRHERIDVRTPGAVVAGAADDQTP